MNIHDPTPTISDQITTFCTFVLISASITSVWFVPLVGFMSRSRGWLVSKNFRGDPVPVIGALPFLVIGLFLLAFGALFHALFFPFPDALPFCVCILGFGTLGLIDDLYGDRSAGGFRGHMLKLVRERKVTTGSLKAVGGGIFALIAAYNIWPARAWDMYAGSGYMARAPNLDQSAPANVFALIGWTAVIGLFIALFANSINLVDLRPGRASLASAVLLCMAAITLDSGLISTICLGALIPVLILDGMGKVMLGDCGSNILGAVIAVAYLMFIPLWAIPIGVLILAAFNIWCEKHSVNQLIEDTPWLRSIDRKIGVR